MVIELILILFLIWNCYVLPREYPRKMSVECIWHEHDIPAVQEEQHTTIVQTLCWGCGAMIEDVIEGEDNWLFCPCGQGIMKVII